jgi:uncharacterized protein (TIRG00374 family)
MHEVLAYLKYYGQHAMNSRLLGLLKLIAGIGLILVFIRQIEWNVFKDTILSADVSYIVVGIVLTFLNMFIAALRWFILLRALHATIPFFKLAKLLFIGIFFNTFVPGGFAGDIVRSLQSKGEGVRVEDAFSSVFTDRLLGLVGLLLFSLGGVCWKWNMIKASGLLGYILLTCCGLLGLTLFLYSRSIMTRFRFLLDWLGPLGQKIAGLYQSLYQYRHQSRYLGGAFGITLINHLLMFASIYCFALALDADISFLYFVVFLPVIGILSMLPLTVGGLGLREFGFVVFFPLAGMTKAQALGTSLFFFIATVFIALAGAGIYMAENFGALMTDQAASGGVKN